ncbi:acyl-CoA dehydrogenase [Streptomyces sp. SLBN-31]|uniref:acyl-CoA dehydrogenase n=1 Tax=Streptomyces sp. SLBN-31 TaxID=2768444 RepID=UPI00114E9F55|nr:acyl-CoA dehydrogenase [Streptomyces sp. SLBN-31]TQJ92827.1 alkylation response protein AidB-like acyl-CoA dehydrogenase [Streptomyces sp. SLBN-31]
MNDNLTAAPTPAAPAVRRTADGPCLPADGAARAQHVEDLLGDPFAEDNPHGQRALLAADERRQAPAATEDLLQRFGLGAEFVPALLGGRLTGVEDLAQVLRPVFRRDVALGFGAGMTALFAASVVWTAGDGRQRRDTARRLLQDGRITILHREFVHANAILRGEYSARPAPGGGFVVDGRKDVVINADRADAFVAYVRTADGDGPDSHSVFLLQTDRLPSHAVHRLPRVRTHGMRGAHYAGLDLVQCPVPPDALIGQLGEGIHLSLRTFQVSRALVAGGALVAGMDSALRYAVRALGDSRRGLVLGGRRGRVLAGVFADLLACDSLAVAGLRLLDLAPEYALIPSAAVKYAVSALLHEDLDELAAVLGARGYDRGPAYGGFQKLVRDLPVAGLGHAGTADTQAVLVPHLHTLGHAARRGAPWQEAPAALFTPGAPGAPESAFDFRRLNAEPRDPHHACDGLLAALLGAAARLEGKRDRGPRWAALADLGRALAAEVHHLTQRCAALAGRPENTGPSPAAYVLVDRYCLLLAAASCLAVCENAAPHAPHGALLAEPDWALLALTRFARRLGLEVPDVPDGVIPDLAAALVDRYRHGHSFDLYAMRLA